MYIGGHYDEIHSFSEFMKSAKFNLKIHGNVMQIFMGDRSLTTLSKKFRPTSDESAQIKAFLADNHSLLVIHSNLRVNLAAPLKPRYMWNVDNIIFDMTWGKKIGAMGVVVHFGTRTLQEILQTEVVAEANMVKAVKYILDHSPPGIKLILEVNAGQPNKLGKTVKDIADIYDKLPAKYQRRVGFCIDTAHLFLAGYHMDTVEGVRDYFAEFNRRIGWKKLVVCHLNDSALPFAAGNDKHANLGKGYIFKDNMAPLQEIAQTMAKHKVPMILETRNPKIYIKEIALIRAQVTGGGTRNENVVKILKKMEIIHLILGNPYQARTYKNSANLIRTYLLQTGKGRLGMADLPKIAEIQGIGKETMAKLEEIIQTGHLKRMDELLAATPYTEKQVETMVELEGVMGIGPKVARKMVDEGVTGVADLKGRQLTTMQTLGFKYYKDLQSTIPRKEMEKWRVELLKHIHKIEPRAEGILAGSYLMGKRESGDIDLILTSPRILTLPDLSREGGPLMRKIVAELTGAGILLENLWLGETEIMGFVSSSISNNKVRHLDLKIVPEESLIYYLLYFGSGERFSRKIRSVAKKRGYKLNQWGLYKAGKIVKIQREEDIFKILEIPYVEAKNRLL